LQTDCLLSLEYVSVISHKTLILTTGSVLNVGFVTETYRLLLHHVFTVRIAIRYNWACP